MDDPEKPEDEEGEKKLPPVDGMEYPTKPSGDVSMMDILQWMEQVDAYWGRRGSQKLSHNQDGPDEEEGDDTS